MINIFKRADGTFSAQNTFNVFVALAAVIDLAMSIKLIPDGYAVWAVFAVGVINIVLRTFYNSGQQIMGVKK